MTVKMSIPKNANLSTETSIVDALPLDSYVARFSAESGVFSRIHKYEDSVQRRTWFFHDRTTLDYPPLIDNLNTYMRIDDVGDELTTDSAILELRRRSGLSWKELACLFNVPRQVVCDWASGGPLNEERRRFILATLDAVLHIDKGSSDATRAHLLKKIDDATPSAFDLLCAGKFLEIKAQPRSDFAQSPWRRPPSREGAHARRPEPLALLLQGDQSRPSFPTSPGLPKVLQVSTDNE